MGLIENCQEFGQDNLEDNSDAVVGIVIHKIKNGPYQCWMEVYRAVDNSMPTAEDAWFRHIVGEGATLDNALASLYTDMTQVKKAA